MLQQISIVSLLCFVLIRLTAGSRFSFTLTTEELGGDSTNSMTVQPLVVHVDKQNMAPEILEKLYHTSNIVFADFPEVPEFINLKEYESMKYATEELLNQLMNEHNLALESVKQNEKYSEIEAILQEIISEEAAVAPEGNTDIGNSKAKTNGKSPVVVETIDKKASQQEIYGSTTVNASHIQSSKEEKKYDTSLSTPATSSKLNSCSKFETQRSMHFISGKHSTDTLSSWHKNVTSTYHASTTSSRGDIKPTKSPRSLELNPTGPWKQVGNNSNITINGLDNGSSFVMPTTLIMAVLLTALIFVQTY